jgi:hypothetical protein
MNANNNNSTILLEEALDQYLSKKKEGEMPLKEQAQEVYAHLYNRLQHKQRVLILDGSLEKRLASILVQAIGFVGAKADFILGSPKPEIVIYPDDETAIAILQADSPSEKLLHYQHHILLIYQAAHLNVATDVMQEIIAATPRAGCIYIGQDDKLNKMVKEANTRHDVEIVEYSKLDNKLLADVQAESTLAKEAGSAEMFGLLQKAVQRFAISERQLLNALKQL